MNITVIGGGNIGTVLLGELSADTQNRVSLLTSKPEAWHRKIEVLYSETGETLYGELAEITNDAAVTAKATWFSLPCRRTHCPPPYSAFCRMCKGRGHMRFARQRRGGICLPPAD